MDRVSVDTPSPDGTVARPDFGLGHEVKVWLSELFARERDRSALIAITLEALGRFLGASRVAYGEIAEDLLSITTPLDWTDGVPSTTGSRPFDATSALSRHYRSGRPLVVADADAPDIPGEQRAELLRGGVRSLIAVPLIEGGALVGILQATHHQPHVWPHEAVLLLAHTGARLWGALRNLQTLEQLRESEEQFRTLAEHMPSLCWLAHADGSAYWGNRKWNAFFIDEAMKAGPFAWTVHPDDYARTSAIWANSLALGEACEMPVRIRGADGKFYPFLGSANPIRDGDGNLVRWCGVLVDLSEHVAQDRRQVFLRRFSDATRDMTDAAAILSVVSELLIAELGVGGVTYSEVTEDDTLFNVFLGRPGGRFDEVPASFCFAAGFENLLGHYRRSETLVARSYDDDLPELTEPVQQARRAVQMCASITVPLVKEGRLVAMLSATDPTPRNWRRDEVNLVEELSDRLWSSVSRARAEAALIERERNQAFLIEWGDAVRPEKSPRAILALTLDRLGAFLGASRINYGETDADETCFNVLHEWRADGTGSVLGYSFPFAALGAPMHAAHLAGAPVVMADIDDSPLVDAGSRGLYDGIGLAALLAIPMVRGDRLDATLSIQQDRPRRWTPSEVQLARDVADRTVAILERARAEEALQDRERSQAFLIDWSDRLRDEASPRSMLAMTLDAIGRHLGVSRANYAEATDAGDALCVLQEWKHGASSVIGQSFPLAALGERVLADHLSGTAVRVEDITCDARFDDGNRPMYEAIGVAAFLSVPLVRGGEIVGVLSVQQDRPRAWTDRETILLRELADRTWAVLERAFSEQRLADSEAQLAAFMENAPVPMHMKDEAGRYVRINPEFARALGRPRDELQGLHPREIFPPEIVADIERIERRALAGEIASAEIELGGDAYASVLSIVFPITGSGGVARTAGFTLDLTERKRTEAALARSREILYQTEKLSALGSLLAGVSHELNNPLSIVVAQAVMMERQARGSDLAERAQKIRKAAERCARIVQTFLAMARQKRPERRTIDLNAVVAAAHDLAEYGLRSDGITSVRDLTDGLPTIAADSDQLHQIVINLIVNAQQAMADLDGAERVLTLRTAIGAEPGTVTLDIGDSGPGIPEDMRRRIFEPFFTTKPQGEGTGIGLSFSQGLAEAHGGRLELLPTERGACFRLTLPIDAAPSAPDAPTVEADLSQPTRRRALVVDDEREIAEALADFLSLEGFTCDIAIGGAAAQARIGRGRYDLIVSDLRMPEMDGPQLHAWIARERPDLIDRVAFATGDTMGSAAARFLDTVKRPVLEKPFTPESVARFLDQMDFS